MDQVGDRLAVGELAAAVSSPTRQASIGPVGGLGRVAVPPEQVGDRVLGEPEAVVHPEPVRRRALGVVEVDLLGDAREQRLAGRPRGRRRARPPCRPARPRASCRAARSRRACPVGVHELLERGRVEADDVDGRARRAAARPAPSVRAASSARAASLRRMLRSSNGISLSERNSLTRQHSCQVGVRASVLSV